MFSSLGQRMQFAYVKEFLTGCHIFFRNSSQLGQHGLTSFYTCEKIIVLLQSDVRSGTENTVLNHCLMKRRQEP